MVVHIGAQKHANCFDEVFRGSSFLPQSTTLRDLHDCDVIIVMLQWKESENWVSVLKKERQSYNIPKTIIHLYTRV